MSASGNYGANGLVSRSLGGQKKGDSKSYFLTDLSLKNRLVVSPPYVPGFALVQVIRSTLLSRMISYDPAGSSGITTELLGVSFGVFALSIEAVTKVSLSGTDTLV